MKLVSIILMFLGSLAFLGVDAAQPEDVSLQWDKLALSSGEMELQASSSDSSELTGGETVPMETFVLDQEKESTSKTPQASPPSSAHFRVKRYRKMMNPGSHNSRCRFGTCMLQKLAQQIYQLTDKRKDPVAPKNKIGPQGYGR
ncbi:pro-adrenomedullin-like [Meriones unguiculatus]|uniref:pro-adrenomedullin-like n=1 Tax=Meriones unguiculatus TaxID=10047 RepID=UPI00293F2261|nr:pro-adrenomedullin-like [Meriones unguiculatus]XP_060232253.1 pro-adrenomedullin-like [Meriones unguiculatus]XP_060232344.1 pro-adrenomedullin-like [Meriones unguiculatus]